MLILISKKTTKKMILLIAVALMAFVPFIANTHAAKASQNNDQSEKLIQVGKKELGKPYRWGATGPHSFDCSGFTKFVYKHSISKNLPRTAQAQYNNSKKVSSNDLQKGDLVYFGSSKHSISHVGMYIGHGKMIDAQNRGVVTEKVHAPWWHLVSCSRPANLNH
ncbi:hypothetical protein WR164_04330 [Philodulcilactobacillus myokoensis]|uniref:NlpC/P60 domain-containing protein n=1 Tax=Philodulcilactobacillus myokoensis TaxID=2929573 RepID=A0A9W6B1L9_9LACO|nr:NlpC/P60 family protein [Philodulcilactobacillus myokoensis]GLB46454.1 hypothetical protein WR164_04330 [Philodulcilactobacillus myokoensis]